MKAKFLLALILAVSLALSVTPAFAQGLALAQGIARDPQVCTGGSITLTSGQTVDGLQIFGCNATVESGATVSGDVSVFGGNLTLENGSRVTGNIVIFGGSVEIASNVNGDVSIVGGSVHLASGAAVNGSVNVAGGSASQDEGATVKGGINRTNSFGPSFGRFFTPPFIFAPGLPGSLAAAQATGFALLQAIITALALAALGVLLVVFFPGPTRQVMTTIQGSPVPSLGVGCLTFVVAPILTVVLAITLIGIPVSVLLGFALAAAVIFGWIAIGYLAGERILEALKVKDFAPLVAVMVGVILLELLRHVPCLGFVIGVLLGTAALGAVVLTRFGTRPYPFTPAWALAGPTGPLSPVPLTSAPAPVVPTPTAPTEAPPAATEPSAPSSTLPAGESSAELTPKPETGTPGEGEPQI